MKRVGNLKEKIINLDNLHLAFLKARRGKQFKQEVLRFSQNFDDNIQAIYQSLYNETFSFGKYHFFTIYDPKQRKICAAPFAERLVHHALMNVCHPYFDKQLIHTIYASRLEKGVYSAIQRATKAITQIEYSAKLDVRKYYDSIKHNVLKSKLRRMFKDVWLLQTFDKIIDSYQVTEGCGLPIGNLTSQYFANLYLSDLDHKAKEEWHAVEYIRYMDDILIFAHTKAELKKIIGNITSFAQNSLGLTLKPPIIREKKNGQSFLGYKLYPYYYRLSGRSKRRFRTKLLDYDRKLAKNIWTETQYVEHILPLLAFVQHAESWEFRKSCLEIKR